MIKYLFADNYKTLVTTRVEFGACNVLLGKSGVGKSTIFEVMAKLRAFIMGEKRVQKCFPAQTLTAWQNVLVQTFELKVESADKVYTYHLEVEHMQGDDRQSRVKGMCSLQ